MAVAVDFWALLFFGTQDGIRLSCVLEAVQSPDVAPDALSLRALGDESPRAPGDSTNWGIQKPAGFPEFVSCSRCRIQKLKPLA